MVTIRREDLDALFSALVHRHYVILGPTVRDDAIVLDEIHSTRDLPAGHMDEHRPAHYRLHDRNDQALFGHAVGPHAWKRYLHPPAQIVFRANRIGTSKRSALPGFTMTDASHSESESPLALIGVRPCDLAAIAIQDHIFMSGQYTDAGYSRRRSSAFIVGVNCTAPGGTCFCASMGTGPTATKGYDILLTELIQAGRHIFLAEPGSNMGLSVLAEVPSSPTTDAEKKEATEDLAAASRQMGRTLDTNGLRELFYSNFDHPRWQQTAQKCLTCAGCTMVCPTCFCSTVDDTTDLTGTIAERRRRWDSCFVLEYSYIHGGSVRSSAMSRYRHWIMHKLAAWQDQFGLMGCTGCGRCITWCPVGIDITEEAAALRKSLTSSSLSPQEYADGKP